MTLPTVDSRVRRVLDASTRHLPVHLRSDLNGLEGVTAHRMPFGWLLWVPDDVDGHNADYDMPAEIAALQRFARALDCAYVLLDEDAAKVPGLPVWDR